MQHFKKILLDLDGTIINSSGKISPKVFQALNSAKNNISISFCTGRAPDFVVNLSKSLNLQTNHIVDDGSRVIDATGSKLWSITLPDDVIRHYVDLADKYHFNIAATVGGIEKLKITKNDKGISRLLPYYLNDDQVNFLISDKYSPEIEVKVVWKDQIRGSNVSITHINGNKKHGIEFLYKHEQLMKRDVIGIGDGINDIPLFESVGYRVGMGNSDAEIKSVVDEVIPSIDDDGVCFLLDKLNLT